MSIMKKKILVRVDCQVSILVAVMVLVTSLSCFFLSYMITYNDMIASLQDRVDSIHGFLEDSLSYETFQEINTKEDIKKPSYIKSKEMLEKVKEATGVRYLYTGKEAEDGTLIYLIDGLDGAAEDFRYPGDPIEVEIQEDMRVALSGEAIQPRNIKSTEWGKIFISYMPIRIEGEVVGVVGIEFVAEHQYATYQTLMLLIPVISILFCTVAVVIAFYSFRRISNPRFKDMANTDTPTGLKNRNAFEVDIQNLIGQKQSVTAGIISIDLNMLKVVNDTLGHSMGDKYIKLAAQTLVEGGSNHTVFYRVGGDEFAGIVQNAREEDIQGFLSRVHDQIAKNREKIGFDISIAAGYALFDGNIDKNLYATYQRADAAMYVYKKQQRSTYD